MLKFDTAQREMALKSLVNRLAGGRSLRMLDVGGFPGGCQRLLPEHEIFIIDRLPGKCSLYAIADGAALPYADGAFDMVFCLDVLEHVPALSRGPFLSEMARVSREWVLVIGPFDEPGVEAAEIAVDDACRRYTNRGNPWLEEHRKCGLPDLKQSRETLASASAGVTDVGIGNLATWTLLMLLAPALESLPETLCLAEAIDHYYINTLAPFDSSAVCYRRALVAGIKQPPPSADDLAVHTPTASQALALPAAAAALVETIQKQAGAVPAEGITAQMAYVRRLEETVADLERQVGAKKDGMPPTRKRLLARLLGE